MLLLHEAGAPVLHEGLPKSRSTSEGIRKRLQLSLSSTGVLYHSMATSLTLGESGGIGETDERLSCTGFVVTAVAIIFGKVTCKLALEVLGSMIAEGGSGMTEYI